MSSIIVPTLSLIKSTNSEPALGDLEPCVSGFGNPIFGWRGVVPGSVGLSTNPTYHSTQIVTLVLVASACTYQQ